MKIKYVNIIALALLLVATSCGDKLKFYGNTSDAAYPKYVDTLKGSVLDLESEFTGAISAYDGMLFSISEKQPDGCIYLYEASTGKRINAICQTGNGPNEVIRVSFYHCFERDSSKISMWVNDYNKNNLMLVDTQGKCVKTIETSKLNVNNPYPMMRVFVLNDSLLIAYVQAMELMSKVVSPSYRVINYKTGDIVKEYKFYSDYKVSTDTGIPPAAYLVSYEALKPDKTKIAMVMRHLGRVNIFDIKTGKIKSIKTKDAPDLNLISSGISMKQSYKGVCCDDHYIYAIEAASDLSNGTINIFDWNGNFTHILQVNKDAIHFALDPIRNVLYTKNDFEEVVAYNLKFLYE